jgi:hypothetical protein
LIEQKLLRLERMSSAEKVRHWGQEKPWELEGTALRFPRIKEVAPPQIALDGRGNITRMPSLIGRPCFGQVAAYLRHGGGRYVFSPRTRSMQPTRCTKCLASKACAFVAEQRLVSTPTLADLYREWRSLGGRDYTWPKKGSPGTAAVAYRPLLRELRNLTFASVNDQRVQEHYVAVIRVKSEKDRERKRRERAKRTIEKARAGEITCEVQTVLDGHRAWRAVEHYKACQHPEAPKCLRRLPIDTSRFDANVWAAYNRVRFRGETPNPYNCSVELHRMGLEQDRSINALRDRVRRSIERLHVLERLRLDGAAEPVWPRFKRKDLPEGLEPFLPTS